MHTDIHTSMFRYIGVYCPLEKIENIFLNILTISVGDRWRNLHALSHCMFLQAEASQRLAEASGR